MTSRTFSSTTKQHHELDESKSGQVPGLLETRALRRGYRELIAQAEETRNNLAEHNPRDLSALLEQSEALREKSECFDTKKRNLTRTGQTLVSIALTTLRLRRPTVKAPNEGILDAKFLLNVSDIGSQMARKMRLNANAFDVDEYIARVAKLIGGTVCGAGNATRRSGNRKASVMEPSEDDDGDDDDVDCWEWQKLGEMAARHSRRAPVMDHLLGPLAVEQKLRAPVKRRPRTDVGEEAVPERLNDGDIQKNENETTRLVQQIAKLLEVHGQEQGCNLFEFAINPHSFPNTVENLFYISFLVRDGKVSIDDADPEKGPILCEFSTRSRRSHARRDRLTRHHLTVLRMRLQSGARRRTRTITLRASKSGKLSWSLTLRHTRSVASTFP